jgi:hypothetical protein
MPGETKEPQSYGSGPDWVSGKTGQKVHDPKSAPPAEHQEFYDERRESEDNSPVQGGLPSLQQEAESAAQPRAAGGAEGEESPVTKVSTHEGGAKRDSYFRKRDYE